MSFLILRNPVAEDFVISHGITVLSDRITGVAFNRVNSAVFHFLNNSCMVGLSVLSGFVVPIEEDDHTRRRLGAVIQPLPAPLKPVHTVDAACVFGNHSGVDITSCRLSPNGDACWYIHIPFPCGESFTAKKESHRSPRSRLRSLVRNVTSLKWSASRIPVLVSSSLPSSSSPSSSSLLPLVSRYTSNSAPVSLLSG